MKYRLLLFSKSLIFLIVCLLFYSFLKKPVIKYPESGFKFPYKEAGLTDSQAAAHLLSRFSFGATQSLVDEVTKTGLEKWFTEQLKGDMADDSVNARIADYDAIKMTNKEINAAFPRPIQVLFMAKQDGLVPKDSANDDDRKKYKKELALYVKEHNFRRPSELVHQFINYKIIRAAYSNNQLHEVLTDFWFNHFNVSFTKKDCILFIPNYERDVIRPNVTGKFGDLLLATAKSPAMLLYLDNFNSTGTNDDMQMNENQRMRRRMQRMSNSAEPAASEEMKQKIQKRKSQGLNENYAREVMELHTMGVDGGYTQEDVTQAARILTGWTLYPVENGYGSGTVKKIIQRYGEDRLSENGFVHDGDFLFLMNRHDNKEKTVLGKKFPANGGYQEGVTLLKMLAHHPSTASFICKKLAIRFVCDDPPKSLLDKMVKTFLEKDGNIKDVLITMTCAPEFWDKKVIREKTKSPFELAISAVRALHSDIQQPYLLFNWIDKMGQKIYYYQAPTGFPDRAQYWINTGALLNRMNFGLAVASRQMRGVKTDLLSLNNYHEPESASAALSIYGKLLMPERDLEPTIKRLTPFLTQPDLEKKLEIATSQAVEATTSQVKEDEDMMDDSMKVNDNPEKQILINKKNENNTNNMLAQVVGIIIGSPEFQRK
jgi:uncharacterized protein (DUF1800 family)